MAAANPFTAIAIGVAVALGLVVKFTNVLQDAADAAIGLDETWKQNSIEGALDSMIKKNNRLKAKYKTRLTYDIQYINNSEFADTFDAKGVFKLRSKSKDCDD